MSSSSVLSMKYRPEIDGLRTISVLLVIFNHLNWSFFSGGYVGVDVFFVISGFLITQVLINSVQQNRFSIGEFYKRRIIRIGPAYFLMLAVTTIVSLFILLPDELLGYLRSVQYSLVFLSNLFMWQEIGGYFSARAEYIPLLHLWSLGVEEQFYILWPIVIWALWRFFNRRTIIVLVVLALIFSVAISEYGVRHFPALTYFMMPTRAFELLIGALLAMTPRYNLSAFFEKALGTIGLGMILVSAVFFTNQTAFPGLHGLLPCIGAALIIYYSKPHQGVDGRLLASAPMVYLGKISYPAYLWHWPIIAFLNIQHIELDVPVSIVVILTTLLLSSLTYHLLELPARRAHRYSVRQVVIYGYVIPTLIFVGIIFAITAAKGLPQRFDAQLNAMSAAINSKSQDIRLKCHGDGNYAATPDTAENCVLGVSNRPVDFLLIGDSHANHFAGMFDVMARDAGLRGYDITQNSTIYLTRTESFYTDRGVRKNFSEFKIRNDKLTQIIQSGHYKAVVLGGSFAKRYRTADYEAPVQGNSQQIFEQQLREGIAIIKQTGAKVILITGNPVFEETGIDFMCPFNNVRFDKTDDCRLPRKVHDANFANWNKLVAQLKTEQPDIQVIEPDKIMCDSDYCYSSLQETPLFFNDDHLNYKGSELVGRLYMQQFGNPLNSIPK